jgi:hypothetical protein
MSKLVKTVKTLQRFHPHHPLLNMMFVEKHHMLHFLMLPSVFEGGAQTEGV